MSDAPRELFEVQAWMQQALLQPQEVDDAESHITPSARQSSGERLAIYQRAYLARLLGVMREIFPALAATVGEETFDAMSAAYLHAQPSESYTLNHLGDRFAEYLQATRPRRSSDVPDFADLIIELARFELAIEEVFDGPGPENEPPLDVARLAGSDAAALRLQLATGARLLAFAFPLNDFYSAYRQHETLAGPPPSPSWLALFRRDYIVRRLPLSPAGFEVLGALSLGATLAEALARAPLATPTEVQAWFQEWTAAGLIGFAH